MHKEGRWAGSQAAEPQARRVQREEVGMATERLCMVKREGAGGNTGKFILIGDLDLTTTNWVARDRHTELQAIGILRKIWADVQAVDSSSPSASKGRDTGSEGMLEEGRQPPLSVFMADTEMVQKVQNNDKWENEVL